MVFLKRKLVSGGEFLGALAPSANSRSFLLHWSVASRQLQINPLAEFTIVLLPLYR